MRLDGKRERTERILMGHDRVSGYTSVLTFGLFAHLNGLICSAKYHTNGANRHSYRFVWSVLVNTCTVQEEMSTRRRTNGGHGSRPHPLRARTNDDGLGSARRIMSTTLRDNGKVVLLGSLFLLLTVYSINYHHHHGSSHDETTKIRRSATGMPNPRNPKDSLLLMSSASSSQSLDNDKLAIVAQGVVEESIILPNIHPAVNLVQSSGGKAGGTKMIILGRANDDNLKAIKATPNEKKDADTALDSIRDDNKKVIVNSDNKKHDDMMLPSQSKDAAVDVLHEPFPSWANVTKFSSNLATCQSTIVTAYFKIPSKHRDAQYMRWMKYFLSVKDCMVIFASADSMDWIQELRQGYPNRTVVVQMKVKDLPINRLHASNDSTSTATITTTQISFWKHQLEIDAERFRHKSFFLFCIWLSKSWFVQEAIRQNYFASDYFMWQDIGSYRNGNYHLQEIMLYPKEIIPADTVLWLAHHKPNPPPTAIWCDKEEKPEHFFHSGSQGVAHKDTWLEYHRRFAETIDLFVEQNMFLGEDQCLLQGTCQRYPDLCAYLTYDQLPAREHRYFGLRYFLKYPGKYVYWRMPGATAVD